MITASYGVFVVIAIALILNIATASIAIECYNENETYAESNSTRKSNKGFLNWMLVGSIICLLITGVLTFLNMRASSSITP